jgi:hypothetical protein
LETSITALHWRQAIDQAVASLSPSEVPQFGHSNALPANVRSPAHAGR